MDMYGFAVVTVFVILFVICLIIAHKMVEKRNLLAKRFIIGRDSPETIERLTKVATEVFLGRIVCNEDELTIDIKKKDNEISEVRVENEKTRVVLLKDGEKNVINKAFSEKSATIVLGFTLWMWLVIITYFGSLIVYAFKMANYYK